MSGLFFCGGKKSDGYRGRRAHTGIGERDRGEQEKKKTRHRFIDEVRPGMEP